MDIYRERSTGQSWLNLRKPDAALINHFNHGTESKTDGSVPSNLCRSSFSNFSLETGRVGEKLIGGRGRIFVSGKDFAGLRVYRAASGRNYFSSDRGESFLSFVSPGLVYLLPRRCCSSFIANSVSNSPLSFFSFASGNF